MTAKLAGMYDWFKDAGLPVVIGYKDWQTYGRPFSFDPRGSIAHHTASPISSSVQANLNVVINGNSVAPGPISHAMIGRDLKLYLVATGRTNNAGAGWWPLGKDTGNMYAFAIEACNNGIGEYWQSEMVEIMGRAYAIVHHELDIPLDLAWTHHAYAPTRKIDPAGPAEFRQNSPGTWTLSEWQSLVNEYAVVEPPPLPPINPSPEDDDDMATVDRVYVPGSDVGARWHWPHYNRYSNGLVTPRVEGDPEATQGIQTLGKAQYKNVAAFTNTLSRLTDTDQPV